ncbi:MAG: hypothetical protein ACE5RT_03175 [Nitrosopumilaceae archaeon]
MSRIEYGNSKAVDKFIEMMITKPGIGLLSVGVFVAFILFG